MDRRIYDPATEGGAPVTVELDGQPHRACLLAFFPEDGGVVAVATPRGLLKVTARGTIYATGGHDVNARRPRPFASATSM